MRFFRWLWGVSGTAWKYSATQNRWASNYGTLWTFVFLLFFIFFAVAWIFGYPPSDVSAWLTANSAIWLWIADWLWRIFWGVVLLVCGLVVFGVMMEFFGKRADDANDIPRDIKGGSCMFVAVVMVGYIAWIAMTMTD
ncbi:hypothetical protein [Sphingomonas bacterium]|uniref:hypothetical protein n=1 Tax=Sphingomonas bacterium TaxID=1895847 RepID=UPI00262725AA|nr:hypothetical protein [Sphingomonas bacterium]MDB5679175.1 hypothetical protein [Sphingomonas bacterium]